MRHFCIFLYLALLPVSLYAQGKVAFSYDAAGNRIKREIVMPVSRAMARQQANLGDEQVFSDILDGHPIKIQPNSSEGILRIYLSGLKNTDKCSYGVYNLQGMQVAKGNVATDKTDVNIGSQPSGVYLLKVTINNNSATWKITKE